MISYRLYRFVSWLRYTVPRRFTPAGMLALVALVTGGALGAEMDQTVAFQLFGLTLAILTVSMIAASFFRGRFVVRRILPRFGSVGEPLAYHILVRNESGVARDGLEVLDELVDPRPTKEQFIRARRRLVFGSWGRPRWAAAEPIRQLAKGLKPAPLSPLRPGTEISTRAELTPLRRGPLRFATVVVARPDPLGLVRGFLRQPLMQSVLILPKRYPLPDLSLPGARSYQRGGVTLASAIGESEEFVSLRDYRPGDPMRHVHWRSWARHGRPIVKEFQDEFFVRHALVLDTFANEEQRTAFEEAVSVAASFACTIGTEENLLDLLFVGTQAVCVTTGRGVGQAEQALEALAGVQPSPGRFGALEELVLRHAGLVCGCVCVLLGWDEPRRQLVRKLEQRGLPVVVLVVCAKAAELPPPSDAPRSEHWQALEAGRVPEGLQKLAALLP